MKLTASLSLLLLIATQHSCNGQIGAAASRRAFSSLPSALLSSDTVSTLHNSISVVFQAKNGVYWFGSDSAGIFRDDGATLEHFLLKGGLTNNRIREIQEDSAANIYFTTLDGVTQFDGHHFAQLPVVEGRSPQAWKLAPGDLWFRGKHNGLYRYDGDQLHHLQFPKSPMEDAYYARNPGQAWSPYEVYVIYKDRQGAMWFGTCSFGFYRYDGSTLRSVYEQQFMETPEGGWFASRAILENPDGTFWINNTGYQFQFSSSHTPTLDTAFLSYKKLDGIPAYGGDASIYFLSVLADARGDLWMATYNQGVWRYDGTHFTRYPIMDNGSKLNLYSIYEDRKGLLWLGTHGGGVYKFSGSSFEKYRP